VDDRERKGRRRKSVEGRGRRGRRRERVATAVVEQRCSSGGL
jgi:hypothetical protein